MAILQRTVFVELDYAVLHSMQDYVDSANAVLAPHGMTLDPILFARHFSGKSGSGAVAAMLAKGGVSADAGSLASHILDEYKKTLAARVASVTARCVKFTQSVLARDTHVVFVTQLSEADVTAALGTVVQDGVQVMSESCSHIGSYGWESWRRMCRKLNVYERLSGAVVGSGLSAKGAIAAGLYVSVCMDPLAQNQDCGGVDVIVEAFDESLAKEMLRILWQKV